MYLDWCDSDNSEGSGRYKRVIVENTFHYDRNKEVSENVNEVSVLSSENEGFSNPLKVVSNIRQKKF